MFGETVANIAIITGVVCVGVVTWDAVRPKPKVAQVKLETRGKHYER